MKNIYKEDSDYGMICLNRKSVIAYYEIIHNDRFGFKSFCRSLKTQYYSYLLYK